MGIFTHISPLCVALALGGAMAFSQEVKADVLLTDVALPANGVMDIAEEPARGSRSLEVSGALSGNGNSNGLGKASWCVEWSKPDGEVVRRISLRWGNECLGDPLDRRFLRVAVDSVAPGGDSHELVSHDLYEGVDLYGGFNTLSVEESVAGDMRLWIGDDLEFFVGECAAVRIPSAIRVRANRKLKVRYAAFRHTPDPADSLQTSWTVSALTDYLDSKGRDGIEGIWKFLDRDNDMRWARPGGAYRLAIVKNGTGYDILLLDGAKVNGDAWHPCMLKGRLHPTVFANHYELEWFDAYMEPMGDETSAQITDNVLLTLSFPLFRSQLRFSKEER